VPERDVGRNYEIRAIKNLSYCIGLHNQPLTLEDRTRRNQKNQRTGYWVVFHVIFGESLLRWLMRAAAARRSSSSGIGCPPKPKLPVSILRYGGLSCLEIHFAGRQCGDNRSDILFTHRDDCHRHKAADLYILNSSLLASATEARDEQNPLRNCFCLVRNNGRSTSPCME